MHRSKRREPSSLVRREHAEWRALLRAQLITLEDHLVFRFSKRNAAIGERFLDGGIACDRRRLVVAVRVHRVDPELRGQRGNCITRVVVSDDQRAAALAQRFVERDQAFTNEFDAPIRPRGQRVENLAIEDEEAQHFARVAKRVRERGVVEVAKIAAKPDERPVAGGGRTHEGWAEQRGVKSAIVPSGSAVYNCPSGDAMGAPTANFTHHFLIAMPAMADPHFSHTLTYVCEHNEDGALGIVVNKPTDMTLSSLFEQIDVPLDDAELRRRPVHFGGPVQVDRGFVLHRPLGNWQSTLAINDGLGLTTSKDVLEAAGRGEGPRDIFVSLG